MQQVFPDYYKKFRCIAGECQHNCCIGWEIDIDGETAAFYNSVPGELGRRLRENISRGGEPHFVLGEDERCPFLNRDNLCDIILTLGEENICSICTDHPRFRNELPGRTETGLGLCCEEAARLVIGKIEPTVLEISGELEASDEIIARRDEIIDILQNRSQSVKNRVLKMLEICNARMPRKDVGQWAEFLLSLERMDESWTEMLSLLQNRWRNADFCAFDAHMKDRQTEYEQLLVYLIYRHFANASDEADMAARAAFAALGYILLHAMGAVIFTETGKFDFVQQTELVRLFSAEIEYSDENRDIILCELESGME